MRLDWTGRHWAPGPDGSTMPQARTRRDWNVDWPFAVWLPGRVFPRDTTVAMVPPSTHDPEYWRDLLTLTVTRRHGSTGFVIS